MDNANPKVSDGNGSLIISLPLTSPTGRVRVKSRENFFDYGSPFFTRSQKIIDKCYLEWQISYDTNNLELAPDKELLFTNYKAENKYLYELSFYLYKSINSNIISEIEFRELKNFVDNLNEKSYLEDISEIKVKNINNKIENNGILLSKVEQIYPKFIYHKDDYTIEVYITHKQKAVGIQAMIYLCLPIINATKDIVGRNANIKEYIGFNLTKNKNNFILDTIKIFSIASKRHKQDIKSILDIIEKKINL